MSGRTSSISPNDQMYEDGGVADMEEALGDDISTDDMVIDTWQRHHCIDPAQAKENQRKCKKLLKKQIKKEQKKLVKEQLKVQAERRQGNVFRITTIINGKKIDRGGVVTSPEKSTTLPDKNDKADKTDKVDKPDKVDKKRLKKEKKEKKRRFKAMRKMGEAPAAPTIKRKTTMVTRRGRKQQSTEEVEEEIEIPLDEIDA